MKTHVLIGAGVIGCALARELLLRKRGKVILLEKESALAAHASGRNSGVIHSGINQKPGSLKAKMCVEGSRLLRDYCRANQVPMKECGTMVVAEDASKVAVLENLLRMGNECGVEDLALLNEKEMPSKEPEALGVKALWSPTGAVVDSVRLVETLAAEVRALGGEIRLGEEVTGIEASVVKTKNDSYPADHIVNCAGLYADKVSQWMGVDDAYRVIPFRGEYKQVFGKNVNSMIYQAPDLRFPFLSVHLTKTVHGDLIAGPTAVLSFGRESYDKRVNFAETLDYLTRARFYKLLLQPSFFAMSAHALKMSFSNETFRKEIEKLVGDLPPENLRAYRSGIRAQMVDRQGRFVEDLVVVFSKNATQVLNCVSPGFTCSLAFAKYLDDEMQGKHAQDRSKYI